MTKHTQRFRAARANTAARIRNSLGQTNMSKINHFLQTATLLFRENHRRFKILMRSRTTCCCSFSWLASGRECMISKNVNAACNTPAGEKRGVTIKLNFQSFRRARDGGGPWDDSFQSFRRAGGGGGPWDDSFSKLDGHDRLCRH